MDLIEAVCWLEEACTINVLNACGDVGVTKLYHDLFLYMEAINILYPNCETHLFCLHYVYMPHNNNHLRQWKGAWIQHSLRTAGNLSSLQLWADEIHHLHDTTVDEVHVWL